MNTSNNFEQQAAEALQRIKAHTNRSAGQHIRQVRRVRAGEPVQADAFAGPPRRVDPATVQPYTPPFAAAPEPVTGWDLLRYAMAAVGVTACAVVVAFAIGYFTH